MSKHQGETIKDKLDNVKTVALTITRITLGFTSCPLLLPAAWLLLCWTFLSLSSTGLCCWLSSLPRLSVSEPLPNAKCIPNHGRVMHLAYPTGPWEN